MDLTFQPPEWYQGTDWVGDWRAKLLVRTYCGSKVCRNREQSICHHYESGLWTRHVKMRTCLHCTCSSRRSLYWPVLSSPHIRGIRIGRKANVATIWSGALTGLDIRTVRISWRSWSHCNLGKEHNPVRVRDRIPVDQRGAGYYAELFRTVWPRNFKYCRVHTRSSQGLGSAIAHRKSSDWPEFFCQLFSFKS